MHNRNGFTLIEMIFVLMIGALVIGVGSREYTRVSGQRAVGNARDAMILTAYRARSEAMRSGQVVYLSVQPDQGLARVVTPTDSVLHRLDVAEYGVGMVGSGMRVCYTARGYAMPGCSTFPSDPTLGFYRNGDTVSVKVTVLGQVRRAE